MGACLERRLLELALTRPLHGRAVPGACQGVSDAVAAAAAQHPERTKPGNRQIQNQVDHPVTGEHLPVIHDPRTVAQQISSHWQCGLTPEHAATLRAATANSR